MVLASLRELGGFAVEDAQIVEIEIEVGSNVTLALRMDGSLKVEAAAVTLKVVATDPLGQSSTAIANPTFPPAPLALPEDNQDENQDGDDIDTGQGVAETFRIGILKRGYESFPARRRASLRPTAWWK
jgi:hypothetical protein